MPSEQRRRAHQPHPSSMKPPDIGDPPNQAFRQTSHHHWQQQQQEGDHQAAATAAGADAGAHLGFSESPPTPHRKCHPLQGLDLSGPISNTGQEQQGAVSSGSILVSDDSAAGGAGQGSGPMETSPALSDAAAAAAAAAATAATLNSSHAAAAANGATSSTGSHNSPRRCSRPDLRLQQQQHQGQQQQQQQTHKSCRKADRSASVSLASHYPFATNKPGFLPPLSVRVSTKFLVPRPMCVASPAGRCAFLTAPPRP